MQDRTDVWASRESLASCAAPALLTPAAERAYFTYVLFITLYYYGFIEGHPMPMGRARVRGGRCELRVITYYTLHGIVRVLHTLANIGDSAKNRWNSVHVRHELYAVSIPGKRALQPASLRAAAGVRSAVKP